MHSKRDNNADLNGLSHFFFLENQITAIYCYSPSNFDQSKYYYNAMKTVAIDDNYVKDDNWYKIFYSILGLKFKKLRKLKWSTLDNNLRQLTKLEKLKSMLNKELITEEEYNAKKQKLIDEM